MATNPYVNKVEYGNTTVMDITDTTAEAGDVASGKVFYAKSGARSVGTGDYYSPSDTAETTIDDADYFPFYDSSATAKRKSLWSNIKSVLKSYFDNYYAGTSDIPAIIPDPTSNPDEDDVVTWVKGASNTNDQVPSLYGVQSWSNAEITTLMAHISQNGDTVGVWNDDWKSTNVRTGWVWHSCLYNIVADNEVEISIDFDVSGEEVVGLYAYRVDDSVTQTIGGQTVNGGAIAIKLTSPIQNASGVDVAINLKRQRTNLVTNPTILS